MALQPVSTYTHPALLPLPCSASGNAAKSGVNGHHALWASRSSDVLFTKCVKSSKGDGATTATGLL